jgi:hypothetical protein
VNGSCKHSSLLREAIITAVKSDKAQAQGANALAYCADASII